MKICIEMMIKLRETQRMVKGKLSIYKLRWLIFFEYYENFQYGCTANRPTT